MNKTEAKFVTSSPGQIAYLLWLNIYPDDVTFEPLVACLYFDIDDEIDDEIDDVIGKYWCGYTVPICEIAECIAVANRIIKEGKVEREWYKEMRESIKEVRDDYINPIML